VDRPRLVARLAAAGDQPVVLLAAPPGYGKTSLLSEWLRCDPDPERRFSWLTLGPMDAEPRRLLALLIGAVRQRFPAFDCPIGPMLPRSGTGLAVDAALPRFLDALADLPAPLVIVLDDAHVLQAPRVNELMDRVVTGLPPTVQLAIATRADPALPLARRRAGGALLELRADDLRFDADEVTILLGATGPALDEGTVRVVGGELLARTEGWPAGVALALRALWAQPDPVAFATRFTGTHRDVSDYMTEEVLRRQSPEMRAFLARTSILRRMTGSLCDALLGASGSQMVLEQLERSNLFLVPLDAERCWYRYHRAFGEVLRAELVRSRPELVAELHRRASAWLDAAGAHQEAAEHALSALRLATEPPRTDPYLHLAEIGDAGLDGPDDRLPTAGLVAPELDLEFGQRLTDRELTILRLLPSRLSQREIADELFLSVNTVKTHSRAIYRKLGVSSRQAATERARELALLGRSRPGRPRGGAVAS
jgi:LuxR family maltose regulon positive regulatory protein